MSRLGTLGAPFVRWASRSGLRATRSSRFWAPGLLLVVLVITVYSALLHTRRLELTMVPDSPSYRQASRVASVPQALSHYRTFGYPLFLRVVERASGGWKAIPRAQTAAYLAIVPFFWLGLALYSRSPWLAFSAAAPLPFAGVMRIASFAQPDFLAAAACIAAVACLLALSARPRQPLAWIGFTVALFAAYQLRPAALFLVGFLPALGWILHRLRQPSGHHAQSQDQSHTHHRAQYRAQRRRWVLGLAAATLVPYLLFASLRWVTVGHFGLVAFGGTNLAGLTANFLGDGLVAQLPEHQRDVANRMLGMRRRRGWQTYDATADPLIWFEQYSDNIWKIAIPAAKRQLRLDAKASGADPEAAHSLIERNRLLGELSSAILRRRPFHYLKWVADSTLFGLRQLVNDPWITWPFLLLAGSLPLAWLVGPPQYSSDAQRQAAARRTRHLFALAILAGAYFVTYLFLVASVSFPFERYFVSMTLFLPGMLCALLVETWRRMLSKVFAPQPE